MSTATTSLCKEQRLASLSCRSLPECCSRRERVRRTGAKGQVLLFALTGKASSPRRELHLDITPEEASTCSLQYFSL